jgi:diguanylate cyclase (GGDEF)-like protein
MDRIFGVLFRLTKLVNSGVPLQKLLESVAAAATELVGAQSCSIMLLDESRRELLIKAASGVSDEHVTLQMGEGVGGWVAEHVAPALIPDVTKDPRFKIIPGSKLSIGSMVAVPLATREGVIGVLSATSSEVNAFGKDHEDLLAYLGAQIVRDIENARLYRLSITDSLTKAYNRQYLYQRLPEEIERSRRYSDPLSVVLFDIDNFKRFNDTWGHAAGDFVLKELVRVATTTIREVDGLVRYGGEEFLMLLPKTALPGAAEAAERLRAAVEKTDFLWSDQRLKVTISVGVTTLGQGVSDDELIRRADVKLYEAKRDGRNRVAS